MISKINLIKYNLYQPLIYCSDFSKWPNFRSWSWRTSHASESIIHHLSFNLLHNPLLFCKCFETYRKEVHEGQAWNEPKCFLWKVPHNIDYFKSLIYCPKEKVILVILENLWDLHTCLLLFPWTRTTSYSTLHRLGNSLASSLAS